MNHFFAYKTQVDKFWLKFLCDMNQSFAYKTSWLNNLCNMNQSFA